MNRPIAITGLALRLPQASSPSELADRLSGAFDAIQPVPLPRRRLEGLRDSPTLAIIESPELFDPGHFGIAHEEARVMDPNQRHLLELTLLALRNGRYEETWSSVTSGVYVGGHQSDYRMNLGPEAKTPSVRTGNLTSLMAGRLAYQFDVRGPALVIDTACSSGLVAFVNACSAIAGGEIPRAIVGAANIKVLRQAGSSAFSDDPLRLRSRDDRCKPYSALADGIGVGEGAVVVILESLEEARRAERPIWAIVRGWAMNHDGHEAASLAAPNPDAQARLLDTAWSNAELHGPLRLAFVEGHGTGTQLGDPIELSALQSQIRARGLMHVRLGSIKSNIGHTGPVAGLAGLAKVLLQLNQKRTYPSLCPGGVTPLFDWSDDLIGIDTGGGLSSRTLHAGLSSFGLSGTNAHCLLESAPSDAPAPSLIADDSDLNRRPFWVTPPWKSTAIAVTDPRREVAHPDEGRMVLAFRSALGAQVQPDDDFFASGGNSMLALELIDSIQRDFGIEITIADLERFPSAKHMAEHLLKSSDDGPSALDATLPQKGLAAFAGSVEDLVLSDLSGLRLAKAIDPQRLQRALKAVVQRHDVLRRPLELSEGLLCLAPSLQDVEPAILMSPMVEKNCGEWESRLTSTLDPQSSRHIAIELAGSHDYAEIRVAVNHLVLDGWSKLLLLEELIGEYEGIENHHEGASFAEFVRWEQDSIRNGVWSDQVAFWRETNDWAAWRTARRPPRTRHREEFVLGSNNVGGIGEAAQREGVSPFALFAARLAATFVSLPEFHDLTIGIPVARRERPQFRNTIGYLLNTVPIRVTASDADHAELAKRLSRAMANGALPSTEISRVGREAGLSSPVLALDGLIDFHNQRAASPTPALTLTEAEYFSIPAPLIDHAFECVVKPRAQGGWRIIFDHDGTLTPDVIAKAFPRAEHSHDRVRQAQDGLPDERISVLVGPEYQDADEGVPDILAAIAERDPDRPAVEDPRELLRFRELEQRVASYASALAALGLAKDDVLSVCLERSSDLVAVFLAALRLGAVYQPIPTTDPHDRRLTKIQRVRPKIVIADEPWIIDAEQWAPFAAAPHLSTAVSIVEAPWKAPPETAYILFTSGSTGEPKGAIVTLAGMLNHLVAKVEDLKMGPSDTVLFTAPTGFDISIWQMLAPCMAGARCICVPQSIARDPSKLWPEIIRTGATIVEVVPSMLRAMLLSRGRQSHGVAENCQVRMMISTGEALPLDVCQQWHEAFPGRSLVNAYGPTECSDDVTHEIIEDSSDLRDRSVPIGNPIRNVTLRIMSDGGEPVPRGEEGELWVFGISVGNGYVGDPEATARSFGVSENGERYYRTGDLAAIGPGGSLHYLGRKDRQVKLGGVRIELEEIEGTLRSAPGVIDAAAVVEDTPSGGRLVAFCQMTAGRREHDAVLSTLSFARSRLPAEMIPASLTMVDAFPTTPNGKRDDAALLSMKDRSESLSRRPPTDISWVSDVYRQVFGVDAQDLSVSFLNAGGTSLDAIRFVAVARSRGVDLDLEKLMEAGSLAALGALGQIMSTPVPATSGAQRFVVPAIARGLLVGSAQDRGSFSTHMFKLVGCTDEPEALAIVNALEERHPILRAQAKPDRTALLTDGGVTQGFATSFSAGCPDGELTATLGALPLDPEGRLVRWVYGRGERGSASAIGMLFHDALLDSVSLDILADSIIRWAGADALPGADPNEVWRWLAAAPPVPPQITHCADEDDDRGEVSVHLDEYPACDPTAMESLALRTFVSACIPSDEDPFVDAGFEGRLEIGGSSISDAVGNFHLTTPIRTSRIRNARSAADVDRLLTTARKVLSDRFEATALSAPEECIVAPYAFDFVRHGQAGPRPCGSKRLIKGKPTSGYQLEGIVRVEYPHVTITLKFDSSKLEPGFAMLRIQDWATGFAAAASSDNAGAQ